MSESGPCNTCAHAWDEHELITTAEDPLLGGIILCPEPGCPCYATWATGGNGRETVIQPPPDDVLMYRAELQGFFEAEEHDPTR